MVCYSLIREATLESRYARSDDPQYIPPQLEDILLTDVNENIVKGDIASQLGVTYLGECGVPSWPCNGIIYGKNRRLFVSLSVKLKATCKSAIFLVDTGI